MIIFKDGLWGLDTGKRGPYIWITHDGCGGYENTIYNVSTSNKCWRCKGVVPDSLKTILALLQ